jgi:flagellar assembly protein FliH
MSARVLTNRAAAAAQPMQWPAAGASTSKPERQEYSEAVSDDKSAPQLRLKIAMLEQQLETLQADSEGLFQQARTAGIKEGEAAAHQSLEGRLHAEIAKISELMDRVVGSGSVLRRQAEEDLVRLSIAIARRILHREMLVDAEALLGLVKAALSKVDQREIHVIRAHPEALPLIERILQQSGNQRRMELRGDARLDRGALFIETARGELDASVDTQLQEIERGFADIVGNRG